MTPQQFVGMAVRLFSIWLGLTALASVPQVVLVAAQGAGAEALWPSIVFIAIYIGAAAFLWFFPLTVANNIIPRTQYTDKLSLPVSESVAVGCIMLGLYLLATSAMTNLIGMVFIAIHVAEHGFSSLQFVHKVSLIEGLLKIVIGLLLVFKARAIAALVLPAASGHDGSGTSPSADLA